MTYSDFTLDRVLQTFELTLAQERLFADVAPVTLSPWLQETLHKGRQLALVSEKARSEFLVVPVLLEIRELSENAIAIYSGQRLDVDPGRGLVGECDFVLAHAPPLPVLQSPIVTIVEAKKQDIEAGLGPCVAQMVGAQMFNQQHGYTLEALFGCVTTGEAWQFLHLVQQAVTLDADRFYIVHMEAIMGVFQAILAQYRGKTMLQ
jgi:hypothetical protein